MSATIAEPVVHNAAKSSPLALNEYLQRNAFTVKIVLEDAPQTKHAILPDMNASIVSWSFAPIDELALEESYGDDEDDEDNEDPGFVDDDDGDDNEEDDDDSDDSDDAEPQIVIGKLSLVHLVNRDTIVQRALISESVCVTVTITLNAPDGTPVAMHAFSGPPSEELVPMSGSSDDESSVQDTLVIDVMDLNLWAPV